MEGRRGICCCRGKRLLSGFFSLVALHGREGVRCTCMCLCRVAGPSRGGSSLLPSTLLRRLVVCSVITVSRGRVDPARCPDGKGPTTARRGTMTGLVKRPRSRTGDGLARDAAAPAEQSRGVPEAPWAGVERPWTVVAGTRYRTGW